MNNVVPISSVLSTASLWSSLRPNARTATATRGRPEGISQNIRNQRNDEIPQLFAYIQLLLSINGTDGRYGTQGTPSKFWSVWREEEIVDSQFYELKNQHLSDEQKNLLFNHRPFAYSQYLAWFDTGLAGLFYATW